MGQCVWFQNYSLSSSSMMQKLQNFNNETFVILTAFQSMGYYLELLESNAKYVCFKITQFVVQCTIIIRFRLYLYLANSQEILLQFKR